LADEILRPAGGQPVTAEESDSSAGPEQDAVKDLSGRPAGPPETFDGFGQTRFGMSE
jgi:hypothetical protein